MTNLLARIRRRTKGFGTSSDPSHNAAQSLPVQVPYVPQKIHPDINALVAELAVASPGPSRPATRRLEAGPATLVRTGSNDDDNVTHLRSLSPLPTRPRRHSNDSSLHSKAPKSPLTAPALPDLLESQHDTTNADQPTTDNILTSITTAFGQPEGQETPPSVWATFGRKQSMPHITDFGEIVPGTAASSQRSYSIHETGASSQGSHSTSTTTRSVRVDLYTPPSDNQPIPSPPSSGFTFGSRGFGQSSPPPPLPPLDHPAFGSQIDNGRRPRTSSPLSSMVERQSSWDWQSPRPKAQDIFSGSNTQGHDRRKNRDTSARRPRTNSHDDENSDRSPKENDSSKTGNNSCDNNESQLGSPFSLRQSPDDTHNLSTSTATTQDPTLDNISATFPSMHSITNNINSPPTNTASLTQSTLPFTNNLDSSTPLTTEKSKGKRKADEVESGGTPPDVKKEKQHRATFAADPRPNRPSGTSGSSSIPPSSYHRKRARISGVESTIIGEEGPGSQRSRDRRRSLAEAGMMPRKDGSVASRRSSVLPHSLRSTPSPQHIPARAPSRRSLSQASIPISALVSPHAPSIANRSSAYHMRDPRKPPRVQPTPWSLSWPIPGDGQRGFMARWSWTAFWSRVRGRCDNKIVQDGVGWTEGGGSPLHAWFFFIGFVLFPLWWIASFWEIPRTRRIDGGGAEKGVVLDDPQVEHDARSWRLRCRVMGGVALLTYVPFIVCVAVFVPR